MKRPLKIGISCFPTFGGSGLIASEIGLAMVDRGHQVHVIAHDLPVRLRGTNRALAFHQVVESEYPALADSSTYSIALASKMIEVTTAHQLDVLHVHYAVPHATAAWMASQVLGEKAPRIVTTLHGTDITLVGLEPSHLPITRYSVQRSDAVTTPSVFLRRATWKGLDLPESLPIEVISNFVDTERYRPSSDKGPLRALFKDFRDGEPVLIHVSNFRPVKRITDVIAIFAEVNRQLPCRLVLVGEGPERATAEQRLRERGLEGRVAFLGKQENFAPLLAACDVFLLPSEQESFGLAGLEAMSCGVPVVATDIGGIPELVEHGKCGYLAALGDVATMANQVLGLVRDPARWKAFSTHARARVQERFTRGPAIDAYEAIYHRVCHSRSL